MKKYLICECELNKILSDLNRYLTYTNSSEVEKSALIDAINDYRVGV